MDKGIAKRLREIAEMLPTVYNEESEIIYMSGEDLNLSGYGEYRKYDREKFYEVPMPLFRAVEHKQQLKDAFKKGQMQGVHQYIQSVVA